jgi:succinoglycan biosynthesis transport protein ExoP
VSPKPLRDALIGFGVGLLVAIGLAFLLEQFDTRLRRPEEVAQILRQPILGRIPRISKKLLGESAVVALTHPGGQAAEAFRLLRTNLEFMRVDDDISSLLVTSCVQGEGKSVCVANLAVTLALGGKKVFIIDADLRRPRQHTYFGLENTHGVSTVVTGQMPLDDALQKVYLEPSKGANEVDFQTWAQGSESLSRVYVLTSGPLPPNPGEIVSSRRFATIVETLSAEADVVLVDSPAMLAVGDTAALASNVDGLMFLADLHVAKRPMLLQAADQLRRLPVRPLGIVIRSEGAKGGGYYYSSYRYYEYGENGGKRRSREKKGAAQEA